MKHSKPSTPYMVTTLFNDESGHMADLGLGYDDYDSALHEFYTELMTAMECGEPMAVTWTTRL